MALTPVEIRHVKLGRGIWGYRRSATDRLLEEVVDSFEEVWRDRADLQDKNERLESDIARYRDLETLLRKTLVSAERSAQELKDQAQREADVLLTEAHAEARQIKHRALSERDRLRGEASRIRSLLRSVLAIADEHDGDDEAGDSAEAA
ncbi:MAG TPA: DivIVA domain-containing protein [Gaiellaceae bacterium]|jgi:cell division initiation protein